MAEARSAWGIDLGQSALKAVKVRYLPETDQIVAEAFDYIQYPKILSQPDAIPEEIVPEAMKTFLSRNDLKGSQIAISVPGPSALARFIQLPPVQANKLHEIVKYEARQQIPFSLEEMVWDYQPLGAGSTEGGFLLDAEVGLFAMKRDQVYQQMRPYTNAKVEVELVQIAPLALYSVLSVDELNIRSNSEGEPGDEYYIVLDMGCDNTTVMVSNGYKIWIRNVSIGGNHFTRALAKEMKLGFAKAEHLKCNATKAPDPRAVFQALRPVFNDYVTDIQRSIGYFSSVNRAAKVTKVIGMGNGFKLAGLQKFLQQNLQYEVERPDAFKALAGDAVLSSPLFGENLLSFAVPYGLALQSLGLSRIHTTLLPPEIAAARRIRKKKPWAVAAASVMLAGFALSTVGNAFSNNAVNTPEFAAAQEAAKTFGEEVSALGGEYEGQKGKFAEAQAKLDGYTKGRREIVGMEVLNTITDCLPRDPEDVEVPPEQAEKKQLICITEISNTPLPDAATWFNRLTPSQKTFMTEADKAAAPSGPATLYTIRGKSWHQGETPEDSGILYVAHQFLSRLQQPKLEVPGLPTRDVTRMGISHATIAFYKDPIEVAATKPGKKTKTSRFTTPQAGGMTPGAIPTMPQMGGDEGMISTPGGSVDPNNLQIFRQTEFDIQFLLKFVPPDQRTDAPPPGAEGEEGAPVEGAPTE
ncbi:type IV pilus assembly protein PilM [Planctomicrobium sp. SH664]|uniref:type IV pilus assembly protein PilM n=1 Tax=Planctomicrobium sp. SH664 TaxID=3448125 RepID=UPI003F5C8F54